MPPRHAYWTIIIDDLPTAFRAARAEELLPTFERLRQKHPSAVMRWFARGRLWESQEAARQPQPRTPGRGKDWRPGGAHRDPRDRGPRPSRWRAVRERRRAQAGSAEQGGEKAARRSTERPPHRVHRPERSPVRRTSPREPRPGEEQPGRPRPAPPPPPPGPDRPPQPGAEPDPVPSKTEEIVIPPGPPERGTTPSHSQRPRKHSQRPARSPRRR